MIYFDWCRFFGLIGGGVVFGLLAPSWVSALGLLAMWIALLDALDYAGAKARSPF